LWVVAVRAVLGVASKFVPLVDEALTYAGSVIVELEPICDSIVSTIP